MPNFTKLDLAVPIAFVCNDAGAANHIFAWIDTIINEQPDAINNWRLLAQGPALKLWRDRNINQIPLCHTVGELIEGADVLVSGTGWSSNLEFDAIREARQQGKRSIAVLDHWTNYRKRFERDGVMVLPDEIWVTDEYARKLAEIEFQDVVVTRVKNLYLEEVLRSIRSYGHSIGQSKNLLYLLEPIRDAWRSDENSGEFAALNFFIKNISALELGDSPIIRLRPHPSDDTGKYNKWIKGQVELDLSLDKPRTLAEAIAWSDVVVGCQTYAMVIALEAGKQVFSSVPSWAPPCVLPHNNIVNIADLVQPTAIGGRR